VLIWDSAGQEPPTQTSDHSFTRAMVWNPANNSNVRKDVQGYNIFCAGYIQLPDGRVLVASGNKNSAMHGIVQTHIFNWQNETWSRAPNMAAGRWYPSVAALGTNEAVIVGGGPTLPEVYQTDGTLRRLSNASGYSERSYPFLSTRPDGRVELLGPPGDMDTIDTRGLGTVTGSIARDTINRDYGSFATYDIGKVLVAGGGDITEDGEPACQPRRRRSLMSAAAAHRWAPPDRCRLGGASTTCAGGRQRACHRNDSYTDLLVGTPYEDVEGQGDSGMAQVIWGSSGGLGEGIASSNLTQSSFGRTAAVDDQLGYAVDANNELGADAPMVASGVPGGNVSGQNDAGWVGFFTAASAIRGLSIKTPLAFRARPRRWIGSAKQSRSAASPGRPSELMPGSVPQARTWAPERARSPTPARSPSSTISALQQRLERRTTRTVQEFRAPQRTVTRLARSWTAYGRAARLTWRSEFLQKPSEPRPKPAASSSSPPLAPPSHRALD
jgi:hypothetical protein